MAMEAISYRQLNANGSNLKITNSGARLNLKKSAMTHCTVKALYCPTNSTISKYLPPNQCGIETKCPAGIPLESGQHPLVPTHTMVNIIYTRF